MMGDPFIIQVNFIVYVELKLGRQLFTYFLFIYFLTLELRQCWPQNAFIFDIPQFCRNNLKD